MLRLLDRRQRTRRRTARTDATTALPVKPWPLWHANLPFRRETFEQRLQH